MGRWARIRKPSRIRMTQAAALPARAAIVMLVASVCMSVLASTASAAQRLKVSASVPRSVKAGGLLVVRGRVSGIRSANLILQKETGKHWARVTMGTVGKDHQFALTLIAPARSGTLAVRAASVRGARVLAVSRTLHVRIAKPKKGSPRIVLSPKTQVLASSTVISAPVPGASGELIYSGGNSVSVGQIVAIGAGADAPNGFLGKVTSVRTSDGQTVASTVPETLEDAVPSGSLDATLSDQQLALTAANRRSLAQAAASAFSCHGSATASVGPTQSFGTSLRLTGHWKLLGGLQDASLTANAHGSLGLSVVVSVKGSCKVGRTAIANIPGPSATVFVGPVPVVLTSRITVYLEAIASAQAKVTSSISASFTTAAGIGWTKAHGFYPIETFNPSLSYAPPSLSASASVGATLTPTVTVLIYGAAGPEIALSGGLNLSANIASNPWWSLTAPVSLTAKLAVPPLHLSSPTLTLYSHTFVLAHAKGPFRPPPPPQQALTVRVNGPGRISGSGISCPGTCSASYASGTSVTLHASPTGSASFSGWSGACSGTGACVVNMSSGRSVSATFVPKPPPGQHTLTVTVDGPGTVSGPGISCPGTCSATYTSGTSVALQASPGAAASFSGWSGACSGTSGCQVTMTGDTSVGAGFSQNYWTQHVYGTCADGPCGLNERNGPCYSSCARIGGFYDGNAVNVVCQTTGELVSASDGQTDVWDRLTDGGYVTDMYVDTPNSRHGFSPPIPQC
jgi:hypothetical protein